MEAVGALVEERNVRYVKEYFLRSASRMPDDLSLHGCLRQKPDWLMQKRCALITLN